jgi:hypothetical protein
MDHDASRGPFREVGMRVRSWRVMCLSLVCLVGNGCGDSSSTGNQNQDNQNNGNQSGAVCGDGEIEGTEECDDGAGNSDEAARSAGSGA